MNRSCGSREVVGLQPLVYLKGVRVAEGLAGHWFLLFHLTSRLAKLASSGKKVENRLHLNHGMPNHAWHVGDFSVIFEVPRTPADPGWKREFV